MASRSTVSVGSPAGRATCYRCLSSPSCSISNRRLIAFDSRGVTFRYKDYRADGRARYKVMTLVTAEFIRRFLIHVLPDGFHRIRHYGLFASAARAANLARARQLLNAPAPHTQSDDAEATKPDELGPCLQLSRMIAEAR